MEYAFGASEYAEEYKEYLPQDEDDGEVWIDFQNVRENEGDNEEEYEWSNVYGSEEEDGEDPIDDMGEEDTRMHASEEEDGEDPIDDMGDEDESADGLANIHEEDEDEGEEEDDEYAEGLEHAFGDREYVRNFGDDASTSDGGQPCMDDFA